MSDRPQDHPGFSEHSLHQRIDIVCNAFERKWIADKRPQHWHKSQ